MKRIDCELCECVHLGCPAHLDPAPALKYRKADKQRIWRPMRCWIRGPFLPSSTGTSAFGLLLVAAARGSRPRCFLNRFGQISRHAHFGAGCGMLNCETASWCPMGFHLHNGQCFTRYAFPSAVMCLYVSGK